MCGGAPSGQKQLANSQAAYYDTLTKEAQDVFGKSSQIFGTLKDEYSPIFEAGPNQQGFSQAELDNLNSEAVTSTGQASKNVMEALNGKIGAEGGGNEFVPQGANRQLQEEADISAENQTSQELQQIKQAGYQQGYDQWKAAAAGLESAPGVFNPATEAASATTGAGSAADQTFTNVANESSSWMNLVGAGLGAAATGAGIAAHG